MKRLISIKYTNIQQKLKFQFKWARYITNLKQYSMKANNPNSKNSSKYKFILPITLGLMISSYAAYRLLLPNIYKFPSEARDNLRKAIWARNEEKDYNKSENYFLEAIESMKQDDKLENNSWLIIGTVLELAEVFKQNNKIKLAINCFAEALQLLESKEINPDDNIISLNEFKKNKNKTLAIHLELYRLYLSLKDPTQADGHVESATKLLFEIPNQEDSNTIIKETHPNISKPNWITQDEYLAALEEIGSYYMKVENYYPATVLYKLALMNCKDSVKKSLLYCNLGACYQNLNSDELALESFELGLSSLELIKQGDNEDRNRNLATLLYNLALVNEDLGNYEISKKYFSKLWKKRAVLLKYLSTKKWKVIKENAV